MADRPEHPRIPPLPEEERFGPVQELLDRVSVTEPANIFTTLVRAPGLFRRWIPFGAKLLAGKLPARDRELLILRTAWNCRSAYEWGQHVPISRHAGLSPDEIDCIAGGSVGDWPERDAVLVRAADELHEDACIAEDTWQSLAARFDIAQLIELPMLVGHYHLVAMTLNSLGVPLDAGLTDLPR
jgi:4-carboxymuconolactone decarboxylase